MTPELYQRILDADLARLEVAEGDAAVRTVLLDHLASAGGHIAEHLFLQMDQMKCLSIAEVIDVTMNIGERLAYKTASAFADAGIGRGEDLFDLGTAIRLGFLDRFEVLLNIGPAEGSA